jgi:hypothetical protein
MWIIGLGDAAFADLIAKAHHDDTDDTTGHLFEQYLHGEQLLK